MDHGPPDIKRPRLSTGPTWSVGHGVSLLHPTPSPTSGQLPHHPTPSTLYQQPSPLSFARPAGPGDHHPPLPPPPPPPLAAAQTPIDDRRQHESDRFPPMQEHRQPSHSPAHPSFSPYHPREPMIKADPAEDTLQQLRRPHSTGGNVQDTMTPVTPHSAVTPQTQSYGEDRRHMSFDNGPPYRQSSYQPQTPLPHPQPYDYPPQYTSHADLSYPIQVATAAGKRKAQRASQACDNCRQLKAKCDELKPCKSCKEKNVECKYREAVPKQQDKIAADILETLLSMQTEFRVLNQRMSRLEQAVKRVAPLVDGQDDDQRPDSADSVPPTADDAYSSSPGDTAGTGTGTGTGTHPPIDTLEARTITRIMEEETEVEPGPIVKPGDLSIPLNHTTLAAFLLKWRPIEALVRSILDAENVKYVDEFPIRQELRRGLLRVWGRGEGMDSSRVDREAIRDVGMMEVQDDVSDAGAPSPADCWGGISGSPGPGDGRFLVAVQTPDFSEGQVWKLVKSFQDNIQNMHPLIIPKELNAMVKLFLDSIQQHTRQSKGAVAKFVATPASQSETGSKRKRSPAPDGAESPSASPKATGKPMFQRSINNALVLLVLALGKICLCKDKIPDVVPISEPLHGSPLARNGYPASPIQGFSPSYASHSHSAGLPSPKEGAERPGASRRSSLQGAGSSAKTGTSLRRNMDVIPGLDYFAFATDIIGAQVAGTSLRHIHAWLLAGLYHGQLGRVVESYAYIKEAGYAMQVKMRPILDRFRKVQEINIKNLNNNGLTDKTDNQLVFAFWTCLQLESDIIAELPLPQTHILAFEEIMPYPNPNVASKDLGFDERVIASYFAQLYLRKKLNQIHGMLYNPDKPPPSQAASGEVIDTIQNSLDIGSGFVPPEFLFDLADPPAGDILAARLRAKYWGAQVITYRHFVREILESNFNKISPSEPLPLTSGGIRSDVRVPGIGPDNNISPKLLNYAIRGIRGLIESTRAFHGLEEKRFIITNVFGTSHAQWGNLLTLSAVFQDPTLSKYVDEQTLKGLFSKTIAFFRIIAHPTSALYIDLRILEGLERKLWGRPNSTYVDHHMGSSFSNSASGGVPVPPAGPFPPGPPIPPLSAQGGMSPHGNQSNHRDGGVSVMSPTLPPPPAATIHGPAYGATNHFDRAGPGVLPGGGLPPMHPQPPY